MRSWVNFWKQALAEIYEKSVYIKPKVIRPFSEPGVSRGYMYRAALILSMIYWFFKAESKKAQTTALFIACSQQ
jgi:hypothetical protein